jgi:glutaryl-CoA dehydrogenase
VGDRQATVGDRLDSAFDLDALLTDEERVWKRRAHDFAARRIQPVIDQDFEDKYFRRELVAELACSFTMRGVLVPGR